MIKDIDTVHQTLDLCILFVRFDSFSACTSFFACTATNRNCIHSRAQEVNTDTTKTNKTIAQQQQQQQRIALARLYSFSLGDSERQRFDETTMPFNPSSID